VAGAPAKGGNPIPMALTPTWSPRGARSSRPTRGGLRRQRLREAALRRRLAEGIRPYNAKHTVALTLANSDAEWEDIKDFFGHTDVKTTRSTPAWC
jgi:integrase